MIDKPKFWGAAPYPHIAVDGFFEPSFFSELSRSMRDVADSHKAAFNYETDIERHKQCFGESAFDETIRQAVERLSGLGFLSELESLLEVRGLIPLTELKDRSTRTYFHVSSGGGFLGSHVDQSYVGRKYRFFPKKIHVCSVVFYGSDEWGTTDGGHTVLFDATGQKAVSTVECRPNRLNIFLHTSESFHGVSELTTHKKRYSLYMDYYLKDSELEQLKESIVRNRAKCGPRYWIHPVVFFPKSTDPQYQRLYNDYMRSAARQI